MDRRKVLIFDPERDMADLMSRAIESHWASNCYLAARQEDCLSLLREVAFDLALLDLSASASNDYWLLKTIREGYPGIIVVVLAYLHQKNQALTAMDHGAQAHIIKPLSLHAFRARLDELYLKGGPDCHHKDDKPVTS